MKRSLEIIPVSTADEVLQHALRAALVPIEWKEEDEVASVNKDKAENVGGLLTH